MVKVYRNLNKDCWSVLLNGKVVLYAQTISLKDCIFRVSEAGRQRVLKSKRKNVHAFILGDVINYSEYSGVQSIPPLQTVKVSYNPYFSDSFFEIETKKNVHERKYVFCNSDKLLYCSIL